MAIISTRSSAIPIDTLRSLHRLEAKVNSFSTRLDAHDVQISDKVGKSPEDLLGVTGFVRNQIQAGGKLPLSVTGLSGLTAQPQFGAVPQYDTLPPLGQIEGQLAVSGGGLYYFQGASSVTTIPQWIPLGGTGTGTGGGGGGGGTGGGTSGADWEAATGQPGYILNKPPITWDHVSLTTCASNFAVVTALTCYSSDKSHYVYLNGGTANATINTNTPAVEFLCRANFDQGIAIYSPDLTRNLTISCANGADPVMTSSTGGLTINASSASTGVAIVSPLVGIYSNNNFATTLTIDNTAAGGRSYLLQSGGPGGANLGWLYITDSASGGVICGWNGGTLTRKIFKLANSTVMGWATDDSMAASDVGFQRYTAGTLLCSDTNGVPASLAAGNHTSYSADKTRYVYMNGTTNPPTINTNGATLLEFICPVQFDSSVTIAGLLTVGGLTVTNATTAVITITNTGGTGGPRTLTLTVPSSGSAALIQSNAAIAQLNCYQTLALVSAGGLMVYSPDASRFLQINAANTGDPTISTSTGELVISATGTSTGLVILATLAGVYSANTSATTFVINNTSTNGRSYLLQSGGSAAANTVGWLWLTDSATGNMICGWSGAVSTRKVFKLAASTVIGWAADDTLGVPDVGLQRLSAGTLLCSDTNLNAASFAAGAITSYSTSRANYVYLNGNTTPYATVNTNTSGLNFLCPVVCSHTSGLLVYSPDMGRYLQIIGQNGGSLIIQSSTGAVIFPSFVGCTSATGFVAYSPDQSRYGQFFTAAAAGSHPTLYSTTGYIIIQPGTNLQLSSGTLNVYGNVGINSGSTLYIYNSANTQSLTIGVGTNPAINSSTTVITSNSSFQPANISVPNPGLIDANGAGAQIRALNTATFVWYNAGNAAYGQLSFTSSHPSIYSSTSWIFLPNIMFASGGGFDLSITRYSAGNMLVADTSGTPATIMCGTLTAYNSTKAQYIYMTGPSAAIVTNAATMTLQASVVYCTGQCSATAHITHASGTDIADIHKAFTRTEPLELAKDLIEPVIDENAWALAPGPDGLHILVKRALGKVVEFILPWEQAKAVN